VSEILSIETLHRIYDASDGAPSVFERRRTLLAAADMAKASRAHTPQSRARLAKFRELLAAEDNNDELEVTGEIVCEVLLHAIGIRDELVHGGRR